MLKRLCVRDCLIFVFGSVVVMLCVIVVILYVVFLIIYGY